MKRGQIVAKQKAADAALVEWLSKDAMFKAPKPPRSSFNTVFVLAAMDELNAVAKERLATWDRDFLLDSLNWGPRSLGWPLQIVRRSTEAQKPDAEREPGLQDRDLPRLRERLERDQKRYDAIVDLQLARSWVDRALALPSTQRLAAVDAAFTAEKDKKLTVLIAGSKIFDLAERKKMFDETPDQLKARKDPLLELAFAIDAARLELKERRERWQGQVIGARPLIRAAAIMKAGVPVAPDANSSLRITFAQVKGYEPRDAVSMLPQTTLKGLLAKHTGVAPFNVPERVRAAREAEKFGRWKDARLGDVPVAFLADADTTGGNSGSPTIDAKGRLVGVNFDRVWENVANDFGYQPAIARNVNADVRYLLWLLEEVEGAKDLAAELSK